MCNKGYEDLGSPTNEELREKIEGILQKPFGEICTSSGVFSGYQLSHKVGGEFTTQILSLLAKEERALFRQGDFSLHSGGKSNWKIVCDVLTDEDWQTLASVTYERVGRFRKVIGIPQGGLKLAKALKPYCFPNPEYPTLIVDDVLTTGRSMEEMRATIKGNVVGAVAFARGECPDWITVLTIPPTLRKQEKAPVLSDAELYEEEMECWVANQSNGFLFFFGLMLSIQSLLYPFYYLYWKVKKARR